VTVVMLPQRLSWPRRFREIRQLIAPAVHAVARAALCV